MRGERLYEEFRRNPFLRDLLLKYTNAFLIQIAQSSICNCYHTLQERVCRWLLVARDAVRSDVLFLTARRDCPPARHEKGKRAP